MGNQTNSALLIAFLAVAFASNPDSDSFRKYIEQNLQQNGSTSWLERKFVSNAALMLYTRQDYKFFSIVDVPENESFL
ncbi:hypothetical protein SmJEL517_g05495 [Synchytrium microbalum]|uniref:Uncharacterized protein n=1 Tax=Synchytrium microbalum TaxID=1806994 RepID=A0A507BZ90_9FUNG|nr:uncharacterized protein SmJEL517_g05495 [Synchytrium microbalum]TPX31066.1 hypothetical protein SmJEL517_g05495 [Synchytrium microbalum]